MAKIKRRKGDNQPKTNGQAPAPFVGRQYDQPPWRDLVLVLLVLVPLAATVFVWFNEPPTLPLGLMVTDIILTIGLLGVLARLLARRTITRLNAIINHNEAIRARLEPRITEEQTGLRMRYVSAWFVGALGIAATIVIWQSDAIESALGHPSTLIVGMAISLMFAFAIAANTINRLKTKRLARDLCAALDSQRLALGTLSSLDAMISACLPNGERTRFNERFLNFFGRTEQQMRGHGWLEVVQADDRQAALELVAAPFNGRKQPREHDLCVRDRSGDVAWLHETLVPRVDERGKLIEFIGIALNITRYVENEASLDKQIGTLAAELADAQAKLEEAKLELSKTKTSRNRFEKNLEEAREDVKNLQASLDKAEAALEKTKVEAAERIKEAQAEARERIKAIEDDVQGRIAKVEQSAETRSAKLDESLKLAKQEAQQTAAENKKLVRAFEKLQEEMGQVRQENGDLREQMTRHIKETREAKAEAAEAHKNEAQHRAKSDRLAQRCDELEAQIGASQQAVKAAQEQSAEAAARAAAEVERRLHEVSAQALATQLRKQLDAVQRMTGELLATAFDGPGRDAAHNTAATVRAMSDLVDQALEGKDAKAQPAKAKAAPRSSAAATSFDLRRTAEGVRDLLSTQAQARGGKLELELAPNLPALVHGDDLEVRTALMSLTDAALALADDGVMTMRLSEDVNTGAHSTIRCELRHSSARVKADALEAALALKSTDHSMPDAAQQPVAHQAAKAWRTIRALQGQHGYMLPDQGGFSLWFTFVLSRPAASVSLRNALSVLGDDGPGGSPSAARRPVIEQPQRSVRHDHAPGRSAAGDAPPPPPPPQNGSSVAPAAAPQPAGAAFGGTAAGAAGRSMPRMPLEQLNSNLGEVVELGGDSARVYCSKPPKGNNILLRFDDADADLELRVEVMWSKKVSGRKHDVGLRFVGLTAEDQKRILKLAMQHRKVTTMLDTA